jgi:hypothetical protein
LRKHIQKDVYRSSISKVSENPCHSSENKNISNFLSVNPRILDLLNLVNLSISDRVSGMPVSNLTTCHVMNNPRVISEASVPLCWLLVLVNDCDRLENFEDTGCLMKDELDLLPKELREFLLSFENIKPNREEFEEIVSKSDEICDSSSVNSEETENVAAGPCKELSVEDLSVP